MQKIVKASSTFLWRAAKDNPISKKIEQHSFDRLPDYLTSEDTMQLYEADLVDSEMIYGTIVDVLEDGDKWSKVIVSDQPTHKFGSGYVGYVLTQHLAAVPENYCLSHDQVAIIAASADLSLKAGKRQLVFGTILPIQKSTKTNYQVMTPDGVGTISKSEGQLLSTYQGATCAQNVVTLAQQFVDLPYIWSGISGTGFDCSGFVYCLYRIHGIIIPRDADDQALTGITIPYEEALPGDLLFFAYEKGRGHIHHVGLYIGDDTMIHSHTPGSKVLVTKLSDTKFEEELCAIRRYC